MRDDFRVLPHRDITYSRQSGRLYTHKPCTMDLDEADVKEANWCPHCAAVINKAAERRARQYRALLVELRPMRAP